MACDSAETSAATTTAAVSSAAASPSASLAGKRGRDPEDEIYLDNLHSHKRYLTQIMASSLNGLTVGDSLAENLMESPVRSESIGYPRDEITTQYSPMSEDSDDSRFCDNLLNSTQHSEFTTGHGSPVSPHRHQRTQVGPTLLPYPPLPSCSLSAVVCSNTRQRGSDNDGRFPSSPNDVCHTADLRRTALLRSVQIRTQGEERPHSHQSPEREVDDCIDDCSSVDSLNDSKLDEE
ncbi:hypothetical protein KSP39_PZI004337 [Platanthera zijinensis]|uniref:Uncharacterized protein n=1 Tax=Platanthera zijinensis TaxID=2320716 RepID=A0AAP0BY18_9ASPA